MGIDELSRLRRGPVAALRDTHNLTGDAEVLKDGIPQECTPVHHVHVFHAFSDLVHRDLAVDSSDAVALEHSPEALKPFRPEALSLLRGGLGHTDDEVRRGVVEEKALLELGRVFVGLNLICQGLSLPQAALERVYRVQVFHHEHIIYGHVHQQTVGEPDGVVRVVQVRGHLYPMDRDRPQLHRDAQGRFLHDEVPLSLELEVNLQEPPQGRVAHLMQRVWVRPKVQERVMSKLLFVSVLIHPVELALCKRQIGGDALHDGQAGVGVKRVYPLLSVALRRVGPPGQHNAVAPVGLARPPRTTPSKSVPEWHGYSPPSRFGFLPSTWETAGFLGPPVIFCQRRRASAAVFARMYFIGQPSADTR